MRDPTTTTMHAGPLGSTLHALRADAGTVAALAAVDWNRCFRRVRLDPVRGIITLMAPSFSHEDLTGFLEHIVDNAGSLLTGAAKGLRHTRLRGPGEPPGTGMEPDCAFYVGRRARDFRAALVEGEAAADVFIRQTAPDLVVEVEMTNADEGKIERYGQIGVRELWRLHGRKGKREVRADFLALEPDGGARPLDASRVLHGFTPGDVCEAVERVRFSLNPGERAEAIARIVRRRQRASVRLREEAAPYHAHPA